MIEAIGCATTSVDLEMFRVHPGRLAALLQNTLLAASRRGVRIRLIADAVGSRATSAGYWRLMSANGVDIRIFQPLRFSSPRLAMRRNHRKVLVVDDDRAFVGGMSFDDVFFENPDGLMWRENMVEIRGPLVDELHDKFWLSWTEAGGTAESRGAERNRFVGRARGQYVISATAMRHARMMFLTAIRAATRSVWIVNPFVLPDQQILTALLAVADEGIDVRLIVPGGKAFERFAFIRSAMQSLYDGFLDAGIRIFEYIPTMLHAKAMLIDDCWSFVGSSNLDARSLYFNHEADLASCDATFAADVRRFIADVADGAREVISKKWRTRGWRARFFETLAGTVRMQL